MPSHSTAERVGNTTLAAALAYLAAGLAIIPIRRDGTKAPDSKLLPQVWDETEQRKKGTWDPFQERLPTEAEVRAWFDRKAPPGIAVIGGAISGNLEQIDFDREAGTIFSEWCALVEAERPGLVARLNVTLTPRHGGGYHVRYRCPEVTIPSNTKLAIDPAARGKDRCLIETRGEGGYALAPGSPGCCHETSNTYDHHSGPPLTELPAIAVAERETLIRCALLFDRQPPQEAQAPRERQAQPVAGLRPGDDFNRRGPGWPELLEPHGWRAVGTSGGKTLWRRPGKDGPGWSATTGYCANDQSGELFAVFSENAHPFEASAGGRPCSCYSRFAVFALLNHGGDFKAAAKDLAGQGYGEQRHKRNGATPGANGRANGRAASPKGFELGPLILVPGPAHRTPARVRVPVAVYKDGCQVDSVSVSGSLGSRKEAARLLACHFKSDAPAAEDVNACLASVLVAAERALREEPANGQAVRRAVRDFLLRAFQFSHRCERGALWSQSYGREVQRGDFVGHAPDGLLEAVRAAGLDAPLHVQLREIAGEAAVLWSSLQESLPEASAADVTPETAGAAGERFRSALLRLWQDPRAISERTKHGKDGDIMVISSSLAGRVREKQEDAAKIYTAAKGRPAWSRVGKHLCAWWRPREVQGEIVPALAMRFELFSQLHNHEPAGVTSQRSFAALGERYGALDPAPELPGRTSGGKQRLVVLAADLAEELLDQPADTEEPEDDSQ